MSRRTGGSKPDLAWPEATLCCGLHMLTYPILQNYRKIHQHAGCMTSLSYGGRTWVICSKSPHLLRESAKYLVKHSDTGTWWTYSPNTPCMEDLPPHSPKRLSFRLAPDATCLGLSDCLQNGLSRGGGFGGARPLGRQSYGSPMSP